MYMYIHLHIIIFQCRIILSLSSTGEGTCLPQLTNASITILSRNVLTHIITRIFYGNSNIFSSVHLFLSEAAKDLICSREFMFQSCSDSMQGDVEQVSAGFSSRTERGYVAVIIFTGALCVVLTLVVFCIFRESDVMRRERKEETRKDTGSGNHVTNAQDTETSEEEDRATNVRRTVHIPQEQTRRSCFYQARSTLRRFGGRSAVKEGTVQRERPSVTYSEVSIAPSAV